MTGYHVIVEWDTEPNRTIAEDFAKSLTEAYPGHPWHVEVKQGVIILKHMNISARFAQIKHSRNVYSASELKRVAVVLGGEFLERANLTRGANKGDRIGKVDGVPDKHRVIQ